MSDVMSVRLHLSGVRVRGVGVDSVDRLEVEVESVREWSRCRYCGFRCQRVWDRRAKRVRDLGVSGRRTTLVWRRRRFCCDNCGERHLEDHAQFQGGLSRRFARRLVADARVMSIRAVAHHHGVGRHRIMGLGSKEAARVAERRRARPCRVLLVDETSIRRRHRYVTVVACGDSGKVLAMIPGRTKGSLARFFREQGAWWCRQVEIVVSDGILLISGSHRAIPARCSSCARPLPRRSLVHPRPHPGATGDTTPRPPTAAANVRAGGVPSPLHSAAPGRPSQRSPPGAPRQTVPTLIPVSAPRGTPSSRALPALRSRRPGPSQPGARTVRRSLRHRPDTPIPPSRGHHHRMGRTDLGLPHHPTTGIQRTPRRDQQPPPSPTPRRPRVHQPRQLRSPRNPCNTHNGRVFGGGGSDSPRNWPLVPLS